MRNRVRIGGGVVSLLLAGSCIVGVGRKARADVFNLPSGQTSLQFVTVGDPGNAPDTTGYGAVPYTYQMGEFDITVAQYTLMLNSVAQTDTYGLYNPSMRTTSGLGAPGIVQSGSPGSYTYSFPASNANFPMDEVSWGDAARFSNWLTNGQPATGAENASTTETGSYTLNGATSQQALNSVTRSASAVYVIPSENEWYKSAYYDPTLNGGAGGYWLYPTKSDSTPSNVLSITGANNANFSAPFGTDPVNGVTVVGAFASSPSAFFSYDQGGNVFQWTDTIDGGGRVIRGGAWAAGSSDLESGSRFSVQPPSFESVLGFRVSEVPEPSSVALISIAAFGLLRRQRHRRA